MTQNERMVRSDGFATRNVAGETILVPIRRGVADLECVFTLDEVGTAIWAALETPRTVDQVVDEVVREFDVEAEIARKDVLEFLDALKSSKLVLRAGEGSQMRDKEANP